MTGSGAAGRPAGPAWDPLGLAGGEWRRALFVDSSGNPRSRAGDDAYYMIVGITGSPEELGTLSKMLYGLKLGLVPGTDPRSWELHGVRIIHSRVGYPLRPRTKDRRLGVFESATRAICESGVTLFGVMADNRRIYARFGADANIIGRSWTLVLERYELYVRHSGQGIPGYVVSDKAGWVDMRRIHELVSGSMRRRNPISGVRTSRVAGIEFVDSMDSPQVQAADMAAYILSRHANGYEGFGEMARLLQESMWVSEDGEWHGWKEI